MSNFERKFGKYAINYLPIIMILCYGVGYIISFVNSSFLNWLSLDPYKIIHGQIWRLITWVILPPSTSNFFFMLLLLFCVYSIAVSIERVIGTYQFNVYIFSGILLTDIGALLLMAVLWIIYGGPMTGAIFSAYSAFISSYYIYISLFVVFALSFPDAMFLFMFVIPIKAKWMVIIYVVEFVLDFYGGNTFQRVALVAAFLNFGIFWLRNRRGKVHMTPGQRKTRNAFRKATGQGSFGGSGKFSGAQTASSKTDAGHFADPGKNKTSGSTRHKCAICGCTELDKPNMQFRFCSKCDGAYEYCEDHLYTHTHVKNS